VPDPRLAATVLILRSGPEMLMLRRHGRSGFAADMWVFPGGTLDDEDRTLDPRKWRGIDPEALSERFKLPPEDVLGMHVAAVRETFEESGILLADAAEAPTRDADFHAWLAGADAVLDLGCLTYWSRWVTPAQEPRRYDTCFFLARAPEGQIAEHDRHEITDQRWIGPRQALEEHHAGRLPLIYPTIRTLEELAEHDAVDALVQAAEARPEVRSVQPHAELDDDGRFVRILHPDEPDYPHELYAG
jgi:8-oxo-dGTP pyrophosphatase MutT (NUDIX family)